MPDLQPPESPRKRARIHLTPPEPAALVKTVGPSGHWPSVFILIPVVVALLGIFLLRTSEPSEEPEPPADPLSAVAASATEETQPDAARPAALSSEEPTPAQTVPAQTVPAPELEEFPMVEAGPSPPVATPPPPVATPPPPVATPPPPVAPPAPRPTPPADPFAEAMTRGLAALDRADHAVAQEAFQAALGIRPGAPQAEDGLRRAKDGLKARRILELQRRAETAEAAEDWRQALKSYDEVLGLDPAVGFAQNGRQRSLEMAELADGLAFHLANPGRLGTEEVSAEAAALIDRVAALTAEVPQLRQQAARLDAEVRTWSQPVEVWLESDNITEVTVYRVGRLGAFQRHALELRPGTYTIVGSRSGYRDVRRQVVVEPGGAPPPVVVRCDEEI